MSATPLYKKLGIKTNSVIQVLNPPKNYIGFFSDFPSNVVINEHFDSEREEFIHIFVQTTKELEEYFMLAKANLAKDGILWISWPKKASSLPTELDKYAIMRYGLDHGLVDTKVASVDADWSALKFVYRLKDR